MIIKVLFVIAALIAVLFIVAALQPSDLRIERSIAISAPPAVAFAYVNDLHKWQEMSPYVKLDPMMKQTYTGPIAGPGAAMAWEGNNNVGAGSMTITESRPDELVRMRLDFLKPFAATNTAEFTFKREGDQMIVTWTMSGKKILITKAVGLVMNMDKMIGGQFEEGLANLKSLAEAATKK